MSLVRLQKFLAEAGVASRRASEEIILAGRVTVNGKCTRQLGTKVHSEQDDVRVDGEIIQPRRKIYVALNKPSRFVCTRQGAGKRPLIGELLPKEWGHLFTVGRLDADSEGLIFLTNDGDFSNRIMHPRYGARKRYLATVEGRVPATHLNKLTRGIMDCGERLKVDRARLLSANNSHSTLELELSEGKNREIRRLLAAIGFQVTRLLRIQIGPVKLGELRPGKWRTLTETEIKSLLPQI